MKSIIFALLVASTPFKCTGARADEPEKKIKTPHKTELLAKTKTGAKITIKIEAPTLNEMLTLKEMIIDQLGEGLQ
jgi:hypothetical protein